MPDPKSSAAALTRAQLREELDQCFAQLATKADYAEFRGEVK